MSLTVRQTSPVLGDSVLLYYHPTMENLARTIANKCDGKSKGQDGERRRKVQLCDSIEWRTFHDGFPNLFIEDVGDMAGKDVIFLGSFHSPGIIFEQLSVLYAIPRYLAKSFHFIMPYFPTGTMERIDNEGQIATAKTLATLLSAIPLSSKGPAQILIYDIHALQERFYFSDTVIPRLETAIPLMQRELEKLPDRNDLAFAFPDDGAYKRFHRHFPEELTIICAKVRDGTKRIVTVKDGNPQGKHVVIVDDLVQTGGTLRECAKALMDKGAKKISAYVTHPVFPKQSWKNFMNCSPKFENFWITDSVPHASEISQNEPFRMLSLCDAISESLLGHDLKPN
ncbi:uncharacterized protein LOC143290873 [Babylonia areolata]|uniref:uncharacterized protein LOC143290873 n=1 Tax=Babylonia areolata TaxID=304850 RepID=UPI003FD208FD